MDAMMPIPDRAAPYRDRLLSLPAVTPRRMFGTQAYFVGPAMFAFFSPTALVVRLPHAVFTEAMTGGHGKPFLSFGAAQLNGWAELPFDGNAPEYLERMLIAAHGVGTHAARSAARRKRTVNARRLVRR